MKKNILRLSDIYSYSHRLPKTNKTVNCDFYKLEGIDFHNENVMLENFDDIHPFRNGPRFPKAKIIFMEANDKNFHCYWLDRTRFPLAEYIYVNGHPCDYEVLKRGLQLHFVGSYYHTANRYSPNNPNVHFISEHDYYDLLKQYSEEDAIKHYRDCAKDTKGKESVINPDKLNEIF